MKTDKNLTNNFFTYSFMIITCLFYISCTKNVTEPADANNLEKDIFKQVSNLENMLYGTSVFNDNLSVIGENLFYIINRDHVVIEKTALLKNVKSSLILSKNTFAEITQQNKVFITPLANPNLVSPDNVLQIHLSSIEPTLHDFIIPRNNKLGAINNNNQLLMPVLMNSKACYLMINYELVERPFLTQVVLDTLKVLTDEVFASDILRIESFKENFFVSTYSENFVIEASGSKRLINLDISETGEIIDFIQHNNELYIKTIKGKIYQTIDDGITWNHIIDQKNTGYFNDSFISDRLLTHTSSGIFEIDLLTGELYDLNVEGIKGQITFITEFDNKIFVSTNTGLYYKDLESFFADEM